MTQTETGIVFLPGIEGIQRIALSDIVTIEQIGFTGGLDTSVLRKVNREHVKRLANSNDSEWPPIELAHIRDVSQVASNYGVVEKYVLIDGRHRTEATKIKKKKYIAANVKGYTSEEEVVLAYLSANLHHGLPANMNTRKVTALALYELDSSLSPDEIARRVGLSEAIVIKLLDTVDTEQFVEQVEAKGTETPEYREVRLLSNAVLRFYLQQQNRLGRFISRAKEDTDIDTVSIELKDFILGLTNSKSKSLQEAINTLVKVIVNMHK